MLCYAMPCCTMLYYGMLCYAMLVQKRASATGVPQSVAECKKGLRQQGSPRVPSSVKKKPWEQPGRAGKCKPNFPRAGLPLKGGVKVCNCRHKGITVLTKETWEEPGRAGKCKPNFPRAGLPLKGVLKVCNCRHKGDLVAGRPRKQVQT